MKLKITAQAGSLESCDLLVIVNPVEEGAGRNVEMESMVISEYGDSILKDIKGILDQFDVKDVELVVNDRGALTPTIKARIEAALLRSSKGKG